MSTSKSEVSTKVFDELTKLTFFVPTYQRGFRWKKQQMRELINDLCDFYDNDYQEKYCLQPLMVCENEGKYEVADGQQRLSALWILKLLKGLALTDSKVLDPGYLYKMEFEDKGDYEDARLALENKVKELVRSPEEGAFEAFLDTIDSKGNIDSEFFIQAVKFVWNEYERDMVDSTGLTSKKTFKDIAKNLFPDKPKRINDAREINKEYEFVWYKFVANDPKETRNKIIQKFQNMNASSVHLTEAELIKAYFIQDYGENKLEFSYQWEQFERDLNDDRFWWFMAPEGNEPDTRMDFLFKTFIDSNSSDRREEFHALSNRIKELIKEKGAEDLWKEVVTLHNTLMWWYNDYFFYHMIGYLVATADKKKNIIATIYEYYKGKTKAALCEHLIAEIRNLIKYKDGSYDFMDVSYGDNKKVINVLLLYNIALLLNAYAINPDNSAERFPFEYYRQAGIDIEHINAKHLENEDFDKGATDAEIINRKVEWAVKTIDLIEDKVRRSRLNNRLRELENRKKWSETAFEELSDEIEEAADINKLNNLALLDMHVNRKYKDAPFMDKRGHIAAARFGLPIPQIVPDIYNERKYEEEFGKLEVCFKGDDDKTITAGSSDKMTFLTSEQATKVRKAEIKLEPKGKSELMEAQIIQLSFSGIPSLLGKGTASSGSNTCVIKLKEDKITEDKPLVVKIRIDNKKRGRNPIKYAFITEGRYERSVIFPGTMWVFMRQYTKKGSGATKSTGKKGKDTTAVWDKNDRAAYEEQMKVSIRELLEGSKVSGRIK